VTARIPHPRPDKGRAVDLARIAHGDLLVVIPGILGSTLSRRGRQVWGHRRIVSDVHRLAARLTENLALPSGAARDPAGGYDDGVVATGVMTTVGIIPGFVSVDGYDDLLSRLRSRFAEDRDAIVEFPYDWRQSNEYTAGVLRRFVEPLLARRRSVHPDARLVLLAHSMGGLVARFYAECLDEQRLTRRVIALGTPFSGSVKALALLANGFVRLGPVKLRLGELARSLPSVAELLPVYPCVGTAPDRLSGLGDPTTIPALPAEAVERSRVFHRRIADAVEHNGEQRPYYHVLLSHRQKTGLWVLLDGSGEVRPQSSTDLEDGGDGTVPRCSAIPPEWTEDASAVFIAGRHSALQRQRETLVQLQGVLTSRPRYRQAALNEISVDAPSYVEQGGEWRVEARSSEGTDPLVLVAEVHDPGRDGDPPVARFPLRPVGGGLYLGSTTLSVPGVLRWVVRTEPTAATPVDSVSDVLFCGISG
jgi:pimeloyl-ACP methyl ester carboxylesterase